MTDPATILAVMQSLQTAIDIGKAVGTSKRSLEDAEMKLKIAELISTLADAKLGIAELKTELERRDQLIKILEESLKISAELEFREGFYFKREDEVPFCPRCWEKDSNLIHCTTEYWDGKKGYYCRNCPDCEAIYKTRDSEGHKLTTSYIS